MVSQYAIPLDALTVKLRVEFVEQTRIDFGWRQQPASGSICYIRFAQIRCPGLVYFHQQRLRSLNGRSLERTENNCGISLSAMIRSTILDAIQVGQIPSIAHWYQVA